MAAAVLGGRSPNAGRAFGPGTARGPP